MNKTELLKKISHKSDIPEKDVRLVFNTMVDEIKNSLIFGMNVKIKDFLNFELRISPETRRKNPQTNAEMIIKKKYRVKLTLPKTFTDRIKEKTVH